MRGARGVQLRLGALKVAEVFINRGSERVKRGPCKAPRGYALLASCLRDHLRQVACLCEQAKGVERGLDEGQRFARSSSSALLLNRLNKRLCALDEGVLCVSALLKASGRFNKLTEKGRELWPLSALGERTGFNKAELKTEGGLVTI